jgi:uncharacterized protein YdeI (YjbR/CyaY-like superfamily)
VVGLARPGEEKALYFASAAEFREWLERNHASAAELWVGLYKKGANQAGLTYPEAVEEALCFGWIDGLARSRDAASYVQRFTPRRRGSNWSAVNIAKVAELELQGRMTPAGRKAFEERDRRKDATYSYERAAAKLLPDEELRLQAEEAAWRQWQAETPSYRRSVAHWLRDAKREETRQRRLAALVEDSAAGRRIKPFRQLERDAAGRIGR